MLHGPKHRFSRIFFLHHFPIPIFSFNSHHFDKLSLFLQNESVCDSLTDMSWYLLPLSQQKDVGHMLNRMQNGVVLMQVKLILNKIISFSSM